MLALIAGQGRLPTILRDKYAEPLLVTALDGFPPDDISADRTFRIEELGSFIADLGQRGITEVCFAGAIRRPPLDPGAVDAATLPFVPRMVQALELGDDAALRLVLTFFEDAGLAIRAAHELLPELLPDAGPLTVVAPASDVDKEAFRAADVLVALGPTDVGQSCVVHEGQVLALEASFGTDWMLKALVERPDGRGGLLYKAPKPGQDRRIDLPVIGPETVDACAAAGLDGIIIEAGGVMLLDRQEAIRRADAAGLFIWVRQK